MPRRRTLEHIGTVGVQRPDVMQPPVAPVVTIVPRAGRPQVSTSSFHGTAALGTRLFL